MSKPLTAGEKNRRANIRAMKAIGRKAAAKRAKTVARNVAAHEARNAALKAEAQARAIARFEDHCMVNLEARIQATLRRADRERTHHAMNMVRRLEAVTANENDRPIELPLAG